VSPAAYDESRLPSAAQLDELLKERRTIRRFRQVKIERAVVKEIVSYGVYAPTNHYDLRAIVVDDPAMMEALDAIIMRMVRAVHRVVYRSAAVFHLVRAITPVIDQKSKVKIEYGLEQGRCFETLPAAIVFIVGDHRILLAKESAQYALYNVILYAQAKGIGSRINAAGSISLDKSRAARRCLGLHRHEHILATVELGYSAVKFRNKVEGKGMHVQWNGGGEDG
jgi:nitroreductase